jgi:competence protein ComEA
MKGFIRKSFSICLLLIMLTVSAQAVFASQKININKATAAELVVLNGIGMKTAEKIVAYRNDHGDFKAIAEIVNVKGVGDKTFAKMADQITVEDPKTQ